MGGCASLDSTAERKRKARLRSQEIDKQLIELAKQEQEVVKVLLLGAGESGKSTLVKQMKIIHNEGFNRDELYCFKPTILDNLLTSMQYVLAGMGALRINLESPKNKGFAQRILECKSCVDPETYTIPSSISTALQCLWNDKGVRLAASRGFEFNLNDSAIYLFENIGRFCGEKYVPTPTDVLRARVRTKGIIETQFKINDVIFRMFDVGGQKSERRKWICCFDDVNALVFVVALSGYDMTSLQNNSRNRLQDSIRLFSQIVANPFFIKTTVILFLNKLDLFREKILYSGRQFKHYFPEYKGADSEVDSAALFVQRRFQTEGLTRANKLVHVHFTTAIDTSNVRAVFNTVMDTIIKDNVADYTLM